MKKLVSFVVLVMSVMFIIMIVSTGAFAQKSTILVGDKTTTEVKKSAEIISEQLNDLKDRIRDLKKDGKKEVTVLERNKRTLLRNPGKNQFLIIRADAQVKKSEAKTDSLIAICEQKKSNLEDELINFTVVAAGKDKQNIVNLKSRNVREIAKAYLYVKYADNMNLASSDGSQKKLIGIVENTGYLNPVVAIVTGPANFSREFTLSARSKSIVFDLPYIGEYTTVFYHGNETSCVTKEVGPNIVYYDGAKVLDFKATLLP